MRRSASLTVALLLVLSLATACSKGRTDEAIATDIKAQFFSDPQLRNSNLQVAVHDGQVTISGEVQDDSARLEAFKLATQTQGVKKVVDQMTIAVAQVPPTPEPAPPPPPVRRVAKPKPAPRVAAPAPAPAPAPAAAVTEPPPTPAPTAPEPKRVEIPAGSTVSVRMIDSIDSERDRSGQVFRASLDAPIDVEGEVVVPQGTDVFVKLIEAKSAGRMTGRSELRLELVRMQFQGRSYALVSDQYEQTGSSKGKRTAATVGGGAALGAIIGAIAGGGKGAAIGAGVGAAGGTGVSAATKGQQIQIPSETRLDFRLTAPVTVTYLPEQNRSRRSNY